MSEEKGKHRTLPHRPRTRNRLDHALYTRRRNRAGGTVIACARPMVPENPLRPWWARALALTAVAYFIATITWWPAISLMPNTQGGDGQGFLRIFSMAHISVLRFHELPLWNAYECGGVPLWDNPEMPVASPLVFLTLPLSATKTMVVWYVTHAAIGFVGMWLFVRHELKLTRVAAFAAATLWACGVGHTTQYAGGHAALTTFLFLPLAVMLWRRAEENVDFAVGLGLLVAYIMLEGGAYPLVHTALVLGVETLLRAIQIRRIPKIARAGIIVMAVGLTVGACRFLPVFDQLRSHKRELGVETDAISYETLKQMYFDKTHGWYLDGQSYVWPEYSTYCGWLVLGVAFLGIAAAAGETWWLLLLGTFVFLTMLGHRGPHYPWAYLKEHVFPFTAMRVPSRFRLSLMMFIAAYVGLAIDRVPQLLRSARISARTSDAARSVVIAIALIGAGDVAGLANIIVAEKFISTPESEIEPSPNMYLEGPKHAPFIDQPMQNRGRIACDDSWPFTAGAPLWVGDVPQAKTADPTAATVPNVTRTQNTMTIHVVASRYARILVNMPYEKNWRTNVGTLVDDNKLMVDRKSVV